MAPVVRAHAAIQIVSASAVMPGHASAGAVRRRGHERVDGEEDDEGIDGDAGPGDGDRAEGDGQQTAPEEHVG